MRKANKIMMITVSVLLSAVLLTTSALSGTLAKYTTSATAHSESARVAKWGVTVEAWVDEEDTAILKSMDASVTTSSTETAMVTITGLKFKPGDDFSDVIHFRVTGNPEVKARVKVTVQIKYRDTSRDNKTSYTAVQVPAGVAGLEKTTYFMPLGFTFGAKNASGEYENNYFDGTQPWRSYQYSGGDFDTILKDTSIGVSVTEAKLVTGIAKKMDVKYEDAGTSSDSYFYKDFDPTIPIVFHPKDSSGKVKESVSTNEFDMGFIYPITWPPEGVSCDYTTEQLDEIGTYFGNQGKCQPEIIYTIEVVQLK